MNTIYALIDPRAGQVRYIGITRMTPKQRLRGHWHAARKGDRWPVCCWLRKLAELNLEPVMETLEVTEDRSRERYWIALYRDKGADLVNATDGGDGNPGIKMPPRSEEHRRKIKEWLTGRKWSDETRTIYTASRKGAKAGPNQQAHLNALSAKQQGHRYPPEVIERMRQAQQAVTSSKRCKLSPSDVRAIRQAGREGLLTQTVIARNYGVSRRTVGMILSGERWGHIH
jgi:DNA-binding transcriptional regulator YiaG